MSSNELYWLGLPIGVKRSNGKISRLQSLQIGISKDHKNDIITTICKRQLYAAKP